MNTNYNCETSPLYRKVQLINDTMSNSEKEKDQNIIFVDLDIIFLRPMIKEVLRLMKNKIDTFNGT